MKKGEEEVIHVQDIDQGTISDIVFNLIIKIGRRNTTKEIEMIQELETEKHLINKKVIRGTIKKSIFYLIVIFRSNSKS